MDIDETAEAIHPPLAPLASSETFSDADTLVRDSHRQENTKLATKDGQQNGLDIKPTKKTTKSEFDSLEKLFYFPSPEMPNETGGEIKRTSHSTTSRIRFSETNQIINSDEVRCTNKILNKYFKISFTFKHDRKIGRIEKSESLPIQQRPRVDSNAASTSNAQGPQTTSQNVLWLCKDIHEYN